MAIDINSNFGSHPETENTGFVLCRDPCYFLFSQNRHQSRIHNAMIDTGQQISSLGADAVPKSGLPSVSVALPNSAVIWRDRYVHAVVYQLAGKEIKIYFRRLLTYMTYREDR